MATNTINVKMRQSYDTEANWKTSNPVLLQGQIAISSDKNGQHKVGDGTKKWTELPYVSAYAADVYTWAKQPNKPSYTKAEVGLGNVDNTADSAKNVLSASKLTTARNITIGNSKKAFDGSGDISYSLADIGAAATNHTHSDFLKLTGGVLTGRIDVTAAGILTSAKPISNDTIPFAGAQDKLAAITDLSAYKSYLGSIQLTDGNWYSVMSAKHRNGYADGPNYTTMLYSHMTQPGNLYWNKQTSANNWQGERTILDSVNFNSFVGGKMQQSWIGNNIETANGWYKVASQTMTGYDNSNVLFYIQGNVGPSRSGFLVLRVRCNKTYLELDELKWLTRIGIDPADAKIVLDGLTWTFYLNNRTGQWGRMHIKMLSYVALGTKDTKFELADNETPEAEEPKNGISATDGGIVNYANSAGSVAWSGITGKPATFTPSTHTHTKSQITDFPAALKNPTALTLQLNGTTSKTYDGSTAQTFNVTAASIGAATSTHTHAAATTSADGFMSKTDKAKLDGIDVGQQTATVVTLSSTGWTGTAAPYTQSVTVKGTTANTNYTLMTYLSSSATASQQDAYKKQYTKIASGVATTSANTVTFKVWQKPSADVSVALLKVWGDKTNIGQTTMGFITEGSIGDTD